MVLEHFRKIQTEFKRNSEKNWEKFRRNLDKTQTKIKENLGKI